MLTYPEFDRVAFSVGLMLLLTVGNVAFIPVVLPLLIPGLSADPWPLLRPPRSRRLHPRR